jgi:hypothetical protein
MTAQKTEPKAARTRRPWKKKTPTEVIVEQTDKLRQEIADDELSLKDKRVQLQKLEQARKIFEA